jgi:trans-2-enoyl-CoA reductase
VGQVERLGDGVTELAVGDWVVMTKPQLGTWVSHAHVESKDVTKVDKRVGEARAATITVRASFVNMIGPHQLIVWLGQPPNCARNVIRF